MKLKIRAEVRIAADKTAQVIARIQGLSDEQMQGFSHDVVVQARENIAGLQFAESTGELARGLNDQRIANSHYRIETTSGHSSYIELGTRFIEDKRPFLWPAYRAVKKKFLRAAKWV